MANVCGRKNITFDLDTARTVDCKRKLIKRRGRNITIREVCEKGTISQKKNVVFGEYLEVSCYPMGSIETVS